MGEWRTHLPYQYAFLVESTDGRVFCSTTGGLFYYKLDDHLVEKLSKVDGLSDNGVSAMRWNGELETLIRKQMLNQINQRVNRDLLDLQFMAHDTYTLCNYFTSNFFVSTGGGASLEFLEAYLEDDKDSDISSFLPGTSILKELSPPPSPKAA